MKKNLFATTIGLFASLIIYGQYTITTVRNPNIMTGYKYLTRTNHFTSFRYTRSYSISGDNFQTVYRLFHPRRGTQIFTIIATHYKSDQKVEVVTESVIDKVSEEINKEKTNYVIPSLAKFGFRGSVGTLRRKKIPDQLAVKFESAKFENVKVVNVLGSKKNNDYEFFILDENE